MLQLSSIAVPSIRYTVTLKLILRKLTQHIFCERCEKWIYVHARMQAFNDFIVEHKEQVETVEELEAKLKGLGDRFCNVTLPAILQLAKQQGESLMTPPS